MPPTAGAWTAGTNDLDQWIQADLSGAAGGLKRVTGVVTQGLNGGDASEWVTAFTVSYSQDGGTWTLVLNNGLARIVSKQ